MSALSYGGCPKCGTFKKSGKRSCCARGGAWFKKCGDASDTKFDHTWIEGSRVCEGSVSLRSVKSPLQAASFQVDVSAYPLNDIKIGNTTQHRTYINRTMNVSNAVTVDRADGAGLTKVVVSI